MKNSLKFTRVWSMPSPDTLSIPEIKAWTNKHVAFGGRPPITVIDPFARNCRIGTHRNDLNPSTAAESHADAVEWMLELGRSNLVADAIIFDPPYSPRQVQECYQEIGREVTMTDTQTALFKKRCRDAMRKLCRPGTIVLSYGWSSVGMGSGWELFDVLLVCHGGDHNDTICIAERMAAPDPMFDL